MVGRRWCFAAAVVALAVGWSGCGSETIGELIDAGGNEDAPAPDAGVLFPDQAVNLDKSATGRCSNHSHCSPGYCVNGKCCPTKGQVCGISCCKTSETCFANACVTLRNLCYSNADCKKDEYCEPAVGPKGVDAGVSKVDGRTCLKSSPKPGRCLKLPPRCPSNDAGTTGAPDAGCLPACEYRPPTVPNLKARIKWYWGDNTRQYKNDIDVWSTPTVARMYDTNCDGRYNELDPPSVVFVSGNVKGTCCSCDNSKPSTCLTGVLRMIDGETGKEIWSLKKSTSTSNGFSGISVALGDVDRDGRVEILAVNGDGHVVLVSHEGKVERVSDKPLPEHSEEAFGWGGGLSLADMDNDGYPEVAYGSTVFSTKGGKLTRAWVGSAGRGGGKAFALSLFADMDGASNNNLELVAGNTVYTVGGKMLWQRKDLKDGLAGVADLNQDGKPDVVMVAERNVVVLDGAKGTTLAGPLLLPTISTETVRGGPPTVADFDGDRKPEVGIAMQEYYYVLEPEFKTKKINVLWKTQNHDLSSSVTGSTVFDFEGDGQAEVVYNDECFLWVYNGKTGAVRFATPTTSFTATEASLVADVDGDGKAEMLMIANGADPNKWGCSKSPWNKPDPKLNRPAWKPPKGGTAYRGIWLWEDPSNAWVGTRTLWNQHTYHVSNICDNRDSACTSSNFYGVIPKVERRNWLVPWLNNFRQNVQDKGLFDAPDPTVDLKVECTTPVQLVAYLRNQGLALLPRGVEVGFYVQKSGALTLLGRAKSTDPLFPGQVAAVKYTTTATQKVTFKDTFAAKVLIDPQNPTFHECRSGNNSSKPSTANCLK